MQCLIVFVSQIGLGTYDLSESVVDEYNIVTLLAYHDMQWMEEAPGDTCAKTVVLHVEVQRKFYYCSFQNVFAMGFCQ